MRTFIPLREVLENNQLTILDLYKITKMSHKRLNAICYKGVKPKKKEKNKILNGLCKLKSNPLDLIFNY
jgi:hypothetical protein